MYVFVYIYIYNKNTAFEKAKHERLFIQEKQVYITLSLPPLVWSEENKPLLQILHLLLREYSSNVLYSCIHNFMRIF